MIATRRRSVMACLFVFGIVAATSISMLIYRCEFADSHITSEARITSRWFYIANCLAGIIYFVVTVLILVSFALRIHNYGTTQESKKKIFFKLLRNHLFVFVPPITYLLCTIPYQIWYPIKRGEQAFFQCGISAVEYAFKVMVQALPNVPPVVTWLIFAYPSNVYMTEFYTETWLGKHIKQIVISLEHPIFLNITIYSNGDENELDHDKHLLCIILIAELPSIYPDLNSRKITLYRLRGLTDEQINKLNSLIYSCLESNIDSCVLYKCIEDLICRKILSNNVIEKLLSSLINMHIFNNNESN
ncbi:unnamed protein product [Adineta steineri]|uniref:RWD domain-containing protein n=1 Tax=Adineta steineri TaxID=433720 RepID=A0A815T4B4_9BILA|nr:unnamed protein product [Adineta steineri]CAF1498175.1 unnamed protein product [Adineta steineri]CAF4086059.1 unnamed protein product [Adineta steineri]CAF4111885.1 unnamed protein product [Adineta steineri]